MELQVKITDLTLQRDHQAVRIEKIKQRLATHQHDMKNMEAIRNQLEVEKLKVAQTFQMWTADARTKNREISNLVERLRLVESPAPDDVPSSDHLDAYFDQ